MKKRIARRETLVVKRPPQSLPSLDHFLEFGEVNVDRFNHLYRATGGQFELLTYLTNSCTSRDQPVTLPCPRVTPAYAIGWRLSVLPRRITLASSDLGMLPMLVETVPGSVGRMFLPRSATGKEPTPQNEHHVYCWMCVVDWPWVPLALSVALLKALSILQLAQLRAATLGAVI